MVDSGRECSRQKLFLLVLARSLSNSLLQSSLLLCTVHTDKKHINQLRRSALSLSRFFRVCTKPLTKHPRVLEDEREFHNRCVSACWNICFVLLPAKYVDACKNGRIVIRQCLSRDANIYCITSHMWI